MDARIFSQIRKDGLAPFGLNIFAFFFLLGIELVIFVVTMLLYKLTNFIIGQAVLGCLFLVIPFVYIKLYKKTFLYYRVVRLRDIINEFVIPTETICNNYRSCKPSIKSISIKELRKNK